MEKFQQILEMLKNSLQNEEDTNFYCISKFVKALYLRFQKVKQEKSGIERQQILQTILSEKSELFSVMYFYVFSGVSQNENIRDRCIKLMNHMLCTGQTPRLILSEAACRSLDIEEIERIYLLSNQIQIIQESAPAPKRIKTIPIWDVQPTLDDEEPPIIRPIPIRAQAASPIMIEDDSESPIIAALERLAISRDIS